MTHFIRSVIAAAALAASGASQASFIETFEAGTADVGHWSLTTTPGNLRVIETGGGNPGGYLRAEVYGGTPTWSTTEPSIYTGDWTAAGVTAFSFDLNVLSTQWGLGADRAVTLRLRGFDRFEAFLTLDDLPASLPPGWNHHAFTIDANGGAIPQGWQVYHWDGTPGTDAEWADMLSQVDEIAIGLWKPMYAYPMNNRFELGLDNVHLQTAPVPEPASAALLALGLGAVALGARRRTPARAAA